MENRSKHRKLDPAEEKAAKKLLTSLPRDVVVYLLKTTNLPIADIIHFCEINTWAFKLCQDKSIWAEIYEKRFADREIRKIVDKSLRQEVGLHDPVTRLTIQIRFRPVSVQLVNIINDRRLIGIGRQNIRVAFDRAVAVISNIYGPMDPRIQDRTIWLQRFQDTLVPASVFRKMVLYTFIDNGYTIEWATGGNQGISCLVCRSGESQIGTKCSNCQEAICSQICFDHHECRF